MKEEKYLSPDGGHTYTYDEIKDHPQFNLFKPIGQPEYLVVHTTPKLDDWKQMWETAVQENNDLKKENQELKSQLKK